MVSLATVTAVVPYAFCSLAVGLIAEGSKHGAPAPRLTLVEWIAFVFSVFTLYACGAEAVLYGFVLLMLGLPVYVWQRRQRTLACSS